MNTYKIVYPYELNHHGVKGMKWGVRKEQRYNKLANKWDNKASKARTGFGKRYAIQKNTNINIEPIPNERLINQLD